MDAARSSIRGRRLRRPERSRWRDAELLSPWFQRRHDRRIERDASSTLLAKHRKSTLTRQPDFRSARPGLRVVTRGHEPVHLSRERARAAESMRIEHLNENRRAPAFGGIGATVSRKTRSERLDEQCESKSLVARLETAQWQ